MRCFYHRDVDAVGTCKNCARGLCPACAAEVPEGLACRQRCEEAVVMLSALIARNRRLSPRASGQYLGLGVFLVLIGLATAYAGTTVADGPINLTTVLGIGALGLGGYYLWFARMMNRG
jgi:hypothetical protein